MTNPGPIIRSGWPVTFLLCLFPLGIWATTSSLAIRFGTLSAALTSLGQMCALVGFVLFAWAIILSSRFRIWEDLFGGMNRAYIAHHIIGGSALLFLLAHPLLVSAAYLPTAPGLALGRLLPSANWQVNFGISTLLLLMALLIFTYFTPLAYQTWRLSHKFLGLAFALGVIHALFVPSDVSQIPLLKYYIFSLSAIALSLYVYRTVLGRFLVSRYRYMVSAVRQVTPQVVEVQMKPVNLGLKFLPGQFIFISFQAPGFSETHPFSISSPPTKSFLSVTPKASGDFTARLPSLPLNTIAQIEGPFGYFTYFRYENRQQVWIAGGIGITPFHSMAQSLRRDYQVDLYYCVTNPSEGVYLKDLEQIAKNNKNFCLFLWYSQTQGRLTAPEVARTHSPITAWDIFLCGPGSMMVDLKSQFQTLGVKGYHIHTEEFKID